MLCAVEYRQKLKALVVESLYDTAHSVMSHRDLW
jgi:hypothetical protein